jgi:hypothetical protein
VDSTHKLHSIHMACPVCRSYSQICVDYKNNGYLTWSSHIYDNTSLCVTKNDMFQTNIVEKIKTHILYSITFFFFRKSCLLWECMKTLHYRTGHNDNIIRRMCFACWITKATNTLRICSSYCFSTATVVMGTWLIVTLCVHCVSCSWFFYWHCQ